MPVPIRVVAPVAELLAGAAVSAEPCGPGAVELQQGTHLLRTTAGSGLQVDRIVLGEPTSQRSGGGAGPIAAVESQSRLSRTIRVEDCPAGCWLVLGEGFHESVGGRAR